MPLTPSSVFSVLVLSSSLFCAAAGWAESAADTAFWRDSTGWWSSENTYLDSELQPRIATYHSVVHIAVEGTRVRETTYKFYPPGEQARYYSDGAATVDQGIELVTTVTMEMAGGRGEARTVSVSPARLAQPGDTVTTLLSSTIAVQRTFDATSGRPLYETLISMPTTDRRNTTVYGIRTGLESLDVAAGDLRGVALFVSRRLAATDAPALRAQLREKHRVGAVVRGDDAGELVVEMID